MKLLMFQGRRIWWKSFRRTLEDTPDEDVEEKVTDALVIFFRANGEDRATGNPLLTKALKVVRRLTNKRGPGNVVLHSFTHLSDSNTLPVYAQTFPGSAVERLRETGYNVWLTHFGHFCEWELAVFGESLAGVFKCHRTLRAEKSPPDNNKGGRTTRIHTSRAGTPYRVEVSSARKSTRRWWSLPLRPRSSSHLHWELT